MIPDGFESRPFAPADAAAVADIINAAEAAHCAVVTDHMTEQDMLDWLGGYAAEADTFLIHTAAGELAAFAMVEARAETLELDGYVHPARTGLGLGTALLSWAESEARRRGQSAVRVPFLAADSAAQQLLGDRGYEYVRSFFRMIVDLDEPPEPVEWPAGCELSALAPGEEPVYHAAMQEAFADHWGHVERPLDEWLTRIRRESNDPSLWFLVRVGGEPAAAAICSQSFGMGWIGLLGVRPAYRRRGLAQRLLHHAFRELYGRGERRMGLGVDATNETGATRLYESVGMRVAWVADLKESRSL